MDVGRISMAMSQNSLKSAVSVSLLKMTMDNNTQVANSMNEMLNSSMAKNPDLGNVIDSLA